MLEPTKSSPEKTSPITRTVLGTDVLANFPLTKTSKTDYYLDESNEYYYEAVTVTAGMQSDTPGPGTTSYLTTKKDKDGNFLMGSNTYKIHLPADMPASNFWAFTLYSEVTRCFIDNENATDKLRAINIDSRDKDLKINEDGSVDLYIGPTSPEGKESNWMQTNEGEGWFPFLERMVQSRLYLIKPGNRGKLS